MPNLDALNFIIAVLALFVAVYSIHYTRKCNRRKITISNGEFLSDLIDPPIAFFEIHNISPTPVTILGLNFVTPSGEVIFPLLIPSTSNRYTKIMCLYKWKSYPHTYQQKSTNKCSKPY